MSQVLIMAAVNGARRTKADHPALPMTIPEIAADVAACVEAGAAMAHVHVRDDEGRHVLDAALYEQAMAESRRRPGRMCWCRPRPRPLDAISRTRRSR